MHFDTSSLFSAHYDSPLGGMTIASDGEALTGLWFDGQKHFPHSAFKKIGRRSLKVFDETFRWLDVYFHGGEPDFTPPLKLSASPFRLRVWKSLLAIPYGRVTTYKAIAGEIAAERGLDHMSAQAVGGAVGHNPISIIIPCHRVVGSDGSLTGYAGGTGRKEWLLRLEKATGHDGLSTGDFPPRTI